MPHVETGATGDGSRSRFSQRLDDARKSNRPGGSAQGLRHVSEPLHEIVESIGLAAIRFHRRNGDLIEAATIELTLADFKRASRAA